MNYIWIFIGGGLGSVARFELGQRITRIAGNSFPFATIAINFLSCFILGILLSVFSGKGLFDQTIRLLLAIGFCGGFSTFSTFTWESFELFKTGHVMLAFGNIIISVVVCLVSFWTGWTVTRLF